MELFNKFLYLRVRHGHENLVFYPDLDRADDETGAFGINVIWDISMEGHVKSSWHTATETNNHGDGAVEWIGLDNEQIKDLMRRWSPYAQSTLEQWISHLDEFVDEGMPQEIAQRLILCYQEVQGE